MFYKNYIVYHVVYMLISSVSITSPSFVRLHLPVSEMLNVLPELRVFVVLKELHCIVYRDCICVFVEVLVYTNFQGAFGSVSYMAIYIPITKGR